MRRPLLLLTIPSYKFKPDKTQSRESIMAQAGTFIERVIERVKPLPGVVSAAATSSVPLRGSDGHQV
jgi:hypothetical protein